jgi:hypothetical protein
MGASASVLNSQPPEPVRDNIVDILSKEFIRIRAEEVENDEEFNKEDLINSFTIGSDHQISNVIPEFHMKDEVVALFAREYSKLRGKENNAEELKSEFQKAFTHRVDKMIDHNARLERMKNSNHTFLVSVDGSQSSNIAFQCALSLRKAKDNLVIFHSYKVDGDELLPPQYQHEQVKNIYEAVIREARLPQEHYIFRFIERKENETVKTALVEATKQTINESSIVTNGKSSNQESVSDTDENHSHLSHYRHESAVFPRADIVVIGFSGRRNEMENRQTCMGSSTDLALKFIQLPIIIAKKEIINSTNRKFVIAVDSSSSCKAGFRLLLTLIQSSDIIIVVHVTNANILDELSPHQELSLKSYYETELSNNSIVNYTFQSLIKEAGMSLTDCLIQYVNIEIKPDYFVLIPRSKQNLSNITEDLIAKSDSSVILCTI